MKPEVRRNERPDDGLSALARQLAENVKFLLEVNGWTQTEFKGYAMTKRIAPCTVDNVLSAEGNPELRTIAVLAEVLGVPAGRLLLPTDELGAYVADEGLRPLPSPRPAITNRRSSQVSGAGEVNNNGQDGDYRRWRIALEAA
jgi:transcriptional regulator with XRE-family HTH domain